MRSKSSLFLQLTFQFVGQRLVELLQFSLQNCYSHCDDFLSGQGSGAFDWKKIVFLDKKLWKLTSKPEFVGFSVWIEWRLLLRIIVGKRWVIASEKNENQGKWAEIIVFSGFPKVTSRFSPRPFIRIRVDCVPQRVVRIVLERHSARWIPLCMLFSEPFLGVCF